MRVTLLTIGKLKSPPIRELVADYASRIAHYLPFEIVACRDEEQALGKIGPQDVLIVLDERGEQKSSPELAAFIAAHQARGTKRMVFFIGGQDGVGKAVRARAKALLGLSRMTFPHELTQAILAEQLYRALSINRGEPYHRQ